MNADHARFAEDDAAYVLGALSPTRRREFEEHLADCDACRAAVVELTSTTALLARVAPERASSLIGERGEADEAGPVRGADAAGVGDAGGGGVPAGAALRARIVATATARARRRRRAWWASGLAAAAAAVVALVVVFTPAFAPGRAAEVVALENVTDAPLSATVELADVAWGTRIEMTCRYDEAPYADVPADGWPYVLVVVAADGTTSELSTWRARPGTTARLGAGTELARDDIAAIEVRALTTQKVLLRAAIAE